MNFDLMILMLQAGEERLYALRRFDQAGRDEIAEAQRAVAAQLVSRPQRATALMAWVTATAANKWVMANW